MHLIQVRPKKGRSNFDLPLISFLKLADLVLYLVAMAHLENTVEAVSQASLHENKTKFFQILPLNYQVN